MVLMEVEVSEDEETDESTNQKRTSLIINPEELTAKEPEPIVEEEPPEIVDINVCYTYMVTILL